MKRVLSTLLLLLFLFRPLAATPDGKLALPENTKAILDDIYSARWEQGATEARQLQKQEPDNPLGYLLEAEAQWWKIWCSSAEFKYGMTLARHRDKLAADHGYLDLTAKAYSLAAAKLHKQESAEMRLYAGMADALAARLYGLRWENRATVRAGVRARENFERALVLDSSLADAYMGLGLYNYYADTMSALARLLRFVAGIPRGNKEEGIRQLRRAIQEGQLTSALARFYLAVNLHNYDRRYEEALAVAGPLVEKYPGNPIFQLVCGDLYAKLGRKQLAEASYRAAAAGAKNIEDEVCRKKIEELVQESMAAAGGTLP